MAARSTSVRVREGGYRSRFPPIGPPYEDQSLQRQTSQPCAGRRPWGSLLTSFTEPAAAQGRIMAEVERERRGAVQILRINRPSARNALNAAVIAGIGNGVEEADADPDVGAVIITGTGDRAFCAGMDLRGFA